ncbi:NeuD/PglB/VioB family sugar acetyltransferase [Paenibacillus sp. PvR148]
MIFWGATGHAKVLNECMKSYGHRLVALFDNNNKLTAPIPGVPLFYGQEGFEEWNHKRDPDQPVGFLVAIGGSNGRARVGLQDCLESKGLVALTAVHRKAFVADDAVIGQGTQILVNSTVGVETIIGKGSIINTGAIVDHECRIGDGVHISPGAHLAGCVEVGDYATVFTGAVIIPRIKIGEGAVVGAGAVVTKDVPPYTVVVGNPARILKRLPVNQ